MAEKFYITFNESPATHPDISPRGYAVIEAVSIWDAADAADRLFAGQYALIFGTPYWERYTPNYPDGEQILVTTGRATVEQLEREVPSGRLLYIALDPAGAGTIHTDPTAPDYPEISSR